MGCTVIQRKRRALFTMFCFVLIVSGAPANGARAQSSTPDGAMATPETAPQISFSLNPKGEPDGSFFALTIDAGETRQLTVQFANQHDQPLKLCSFVSDTFTLITDGLGVRDGDQNTEVPASWIAYPTDAYSLKPTEGREISFKVTVPKDAKPGKPYRSARVSDGGCGAVRGTALVDQIIRKTIAVDITVSGASVPAFSIGDVTYATGPSVPSLSVDIANTGSV